MNYCEKYFDLIEDLIDGELAESTAEQVDSHVFACQKCREQYQTLNREKEIYAHYLFETEPPKNLWENFQTRLILERGKTPLFIDIPVKSSRGRINIFGFPALTAFGAALLFIWGINLFWLDNTPAEDDKYLAGTGVGNSQLQLDSGKFKERFAADWQAETGKDILPGNNESITKNKSLKAANNFPVVSKSLASKNIEIKHKSVLLREKKNQPGEILLDKEEQAVLTTKILETDIASQIEKVELLLRSFRNSRSVGNVENFDIEYERQQARKLLEKNAKLRNSAENYGITYAEELLSRIEPYLLDIANLEANPAPNKVLDIKKRVSNQNIIASLQVY